MKLIITGLVSWFVASPDSAINPDPGKYYIACRWDYRTIGHQLHLTSGGVKRALKSARVIVTNPANGRKHAAVVADWGPSKRTKRAIDMSYALMRELELQTDERATVEVYVHADWAGTMPIERIKNDK